MLEGTKVVLMFVKVRAETRMFRHDRSGKGLQGRKR